jgi:hypothetical protein
VREAAMLEACAQVAELPDIEGSITRLRVEHFE